MQRESSANIFVAPLQIRKVTSHDDSPVRPPTAHNDRLSDDLAQSLSPLRGRFQNYLRAAYPFRPTSAPSPSSVTLPLSSGDIILIHSVHTNGWADGTLLETGERGWLPTNYCEAYDYAAMRPLLRALTDFWDIMRSGSESNLIVFQNKDYMRGLVAGVRYLLEKCDCLTRDSPNVKRHDGIRRTRKGLLSDLSLLVKAGKQLQNIIPTATSQIDLDDSLDDLLLHAFKIVTRAVKFFDVWGEEIAYSRTLAEFDGIEADQNRPSTKVDPAATYAPQVTVPISPRERNSAFQPGASPQPRQENKRASVSHRMSYSANPGRKLHLASDRLNQCYDAFLGVLASFLGSHMQSRSSSELLLTTQQAVKSCRQLLSIVEMVIDRNFNANRSLTESKDSMYDAITELVNAAKQVFRPLHSNDDEPIYLPEQGRRLVQAATKCVSGAGRCVAKTRGVLEDGGDFEIDLSDEQSSDSGNSETPNRHSSIEPAPLAGLQTSALSQSRGHQLPWLQISEEAPSLRGDSPSTLNTSVPPTPADEHHVDNVLPPLASQSTLQSPRLDRPISNEFAVPVGHLRHKSMVRNITHSTASDSTYGSPKAMTDSSDMSTASTKATSYRGVGGSTKFSSSESLTQSHPSDEGEAVVLEKTFAHELMFNKDGQIIGGTLNALIERLTAHDCTPEALFVSTVYLTFRLFAKPQEFVAALVYRFRYAGESERLAGPVRLRVYNVFKGWLESHWRHDCDDIALPDIIGFAREDLAPVLMTASKRLLELAAKVGSVHAPAVPRVLSAIGKTTTASAPATNPATNMPNPVISKSQLNALKTWRMGGAQIGILDFDALELARQITLKTSQNFCSILPEELLATEWTKQSNSLAVNVRAMSTLSTDISNLVSDSILQLEEPKKRAATIKQWVKIATKCVSLHNYDTVFAIVASVDSMIIKRMRKTWELVPQKSKNALEELKKICDHSKNYSNFRQVIAAEVPPCIPFIGVYLTDLTFVDHGNPVTRQLSRDGEASVSVINLDKHMKTARLISDLQRFQIPYRLHEVSELQTWMQDQLIRVRSEGEKTLQNQYRRSLILEPRETARLSPNPDSAARERFDFLAWRGLGREKAVA